ncbi:helix-turn-helix domain-containing protein [Ruminococcus sp.]|uniref:helix-turn-helix domain-containing protein n=1 Tax=Ruminococcus sp. TaxID=41978 RepID=UPI00388E19E3
MMTVGQKIKKIRKLEKCWSRETLAILLDINIRTIQNWENGLTQPTLRHFAKLLQAFEISVDEFMEGVDIDA